MIYRVGDYYTTNVDEATKRAVFERNTLHNEVETESIEFDEELFCKTINNLTSEIASVNYTLDRVLEWIHLEEE